MAGFTGFLGFATLNDTALSAALDKQLKEILVEGAVEWVRTVAAIIPNWSGESRASLRPLADLVGVSIFAGSVGAGVPDRTSEGRAKGFGELISESGVYSFNWSSDVFHLSYNEAHNANLVGFHLRNPGPYESQEQAKRSFVKTIESRLKALDVRKEVSRNLKIVRRRLNG